MVIAHNPWKTKEYVLECDSKSERPTTWIFRALLEHEMATLLDGHKTDGIGSQAHRTVTWALTGVRDFLDEDGKQVELKRAEGALVPQEFMNRLEFSWVGELAGEIGAYSKLEQDDVEKPAPSPTE